MKKESDENVFRSINNSLTSFHDRLSKFDVQPTTSVSEEKHSKVVFSVETFFKNRHAPILDLVLRLPTNDPRLLMLMSQKEDKGGSSKDGEEEKGNVVGKVYTTQILTLILVKHVPTASTTTSSQNVKVVVSKLPSKKGMNIN